MYLGTTQPEKGDGTFVLDRDVIALGCPGNAMELGLLPREYQLEDRLVDSKN